ncbi:hypothetical protein SCA6_000024 [Theobroma cacao]
MSSTLNIDKLSQFLVPANHVTDMEDYLRKNFAVEHKRPSEEALRRWRRAVSVVKNPRRRFRMVADLAKRAEADRKRINLQVLFHFLFSPANGDDYRVKSLSVCVEYFCTYYTFIMFCQEKLRVALYVQKAALHFIDAGKRVQYKLPEDVRQAGFGIGADELAFVVHSHDIKSFEDHGGVEGLAKKVSVSLTDGVVPTNIPLRQKIYGYNQFAEKPARSFWMFVWEALHDLTLIILMVCAAVSIGVGIATEGWPAGMYDGIGIVLCIFLVVLVTAISDYKQSLQFNDLDKEKKNIVVQVTRDGCRQKISIYDLVVGDIVHLSIGDQVPADGVLISGFSLSIDESSLSGESEPVNVTQQRPFLLAGAKVQDGSAKMLVTTVGMRTEWGRIMVTLSEGGEDETPLQVKLNGVATVIGKIGLGFAVLTFLVLTIRFVVTKALHGEITDWSSIFQNTGAEVVKGKDGKNNILGSPTETAILEFGLLLGGAFKIHRKESEILKVEPFNSEKKKMSVLVSLSNGGGHRAFCKGASEIILKSCNKIINADGKAEPLSGEQKKCITDVINGFACEALRTLCLAFKDVKDTSKVDSIPEDSYTLIAVVGIKDPVRPGVKEAVKTCLAAGITVRMVTGDNINTAKAIARECGILTDDGLAIEGPDFRDMSPQQMEETLPKLQVFNEINSRDMEKVNVIRGIFDSWLFIMVVVSTVASQSIIVELLGTFANTVPLSWDLWLVSILLGAGSLIVAVILKCIPVGKGKEAATTTNHDGYEPLPNGPDMA